MNCNEAHDLLVDSLLDRLDPREAELLQRHLTSCPGCQATDEETRELWETLGRLDPPKPDSAALIRFGRRLERSRMAPRRAAALQTAAALALLLAGGALGLLLGPVSGLDQSAEDGPQFLLLLRGDEPDQRLPATQLIEEYSAWASDLASGGALVLGQELTSDVVPWVGAKEDLVENPATRVSGIFLVRAATYDSAVTIARGSPHVAYGGLVEVRRIQFNR